MAVSPLSGDSKVPRCRAVKKNGERCKAVAGKETGLCAHHDPTLKDVMKAGRLSGHMVNKQTEVSLPAPLTLADLISTVGATIRGVASGAIIPQRGQIVGQLAKVQFELIQERDKDKKPVTSDAAKTLTDDELKQKIRTLRSVSK